MKTIKNLFRRKITKEFLKKHFEQTEDPNCFDTYYISKIPNCTSIYQENLYIEDRENRICVLRGIDVPSYWIMDVEYIYQLRRLLRLFGIRIKL
jgi:hypothetical protein